jgi:hypothetical protein
MERARTWARPIPRPAQAGQTRSFAHRPCKRTETFLTEAPRPKMTRGTVIGRRQGGRSNGRSTNDLGHEDIAGEGVSVGRAACNGRPVHGANLLNSCEHKHASARRASNICWLWPRDCSRVALIVSHRGQRACAGYMGAEGTPQSPQEKDAFVSPYRDRARPPELRPIPNTWPGGLPEVPLAFAPGEGAYRLTRIG